MAEDPNPPGESQEAPERKTPDEWAEVTGNIIRQRMAGRVTLAAGSTSNLSAAHRAAAIPHGWEAIKSESAEPFRVTRDDYLSAIKASGECDSKGRVCIHPAAAIERIEKSHAERAAAEEKAAKEAEAAKAKESR